MSLKERFINELKKSDDGLEDADVQRVFGSEYRSLVGVVQELLDEHKISILQGSGGYIYQLASEQQMNKDTVLSSLTDADRLVYQCVERSGDQGIWVRDIRNRTSLHTKTVVSRIIKRLEKMKLIKSFKSISSNKKVMYILYDIEIPKSLIGGSWYTDQEYDTEFIDIMSKYVSKLLTEEIYGLDTQSILTKIASSGISKLDILEWWRSNVYMLNFTVV